ncbi:GNAT family N-acetyltransferase, partial [bacterium]|nr:GNAT family N-acetyltransferase [bacterium]
LSADDWHSRFYDLSFGRIAPFLTNAADDGLRDDLLDQLLDTARIAGFNHLITRVDGSEFAAQRALASRGFNLVDVSVKMSGPIAGGAPPAIDPDMAVRSYRDSDLPTLMGMVATSHPHNHYYNDPHLSKDGTDRLFGAWVERCCSGLASHVYILERQGEPVGFILYLTPKSLNERMGTRLVILDFVCIDANARGAGLGRRLISETLGRLSTEFDQIELRTSHNNYAALKCYADLGMRIVSTDFVLHRNG